jgi:hypothetical protein
LRSNDVISAMFTALHTDIEIPFKSCALLAGLRVGWMYTWSDIIPGFTSDIMSVNLLYSGGIRY